MASTIPLLRQDHVNFALLLSVIERQIEVIQTGGVPDLALLEQIVAYVQTYSQEFHHPKEDLIYSLLLTHMPELTLEITALIQEHRDMLRRTALFECSIKDFHPTNADSRKDLCAQARLFVDQQRKHMSVEEAHILPIALHRLSAEEWAVVDRAMANAADPVFGDSASVPFETLRKAIMASRFRLPGQILQ